MTPAERLEHLASDDPERIESALIDLVAHGSAAEFDDLTSGYRVICGDLEASGRGHVLKGWRKQRKLATVVAILGLAPAGTRSQRMRDEITRLSLSGESATATKRLDLATLARFASLEQLTVADCTELRGLDTGCVQLTRLELADLGIESLDLTGNTVIDTLWIKHCPRLASLRGLPQRLSNLSLRALPALAAVDLGKATRIFNLSSTDAPCPGPPPALEECHNLDVDAPDPAALTHLKAVRTVRLRRLTTTAPVAAIPRLVELDVEGDDLVLTPLKLGWLGTLTIRSARLTALAGLTGSELAALYDVTIAGDVLDDIGWLSTLPAVTKLAIHAPALTDVSPLAALRSLKELDLSGSKKLKDLGPLADMPLEKLILTKTGATRTTVPERLHPVVQPPSVVAAKKPRGPKPVAVGGKERVTLARVKKLVLSRDLEAIAQGLELLRSLGDPTLFEGLLSGTTLEDVPIDDFVPSYFDGELRRCNVTQAPRFVPNELLAYSPVLRPFREALIRGLIAHAPPDTTGAALRARIHSLVCNAMDRRHHPHAVDLGPIAALPELTTLALYRAIVTHGAALAQAPKLTNLVFLAPEGDLSGLASPTVTMLIVKDGNRVGRLGDLAAFPALTRGIFEVGSGTVIDGVAPALEHVDLESPPSRAIIAALASPTLSYFSAPAAANLSIYAPLARTPIHALYLGGKDGAADLAPLGDLSTLVHLSYTAPGARNVGALARLPKLDSLSLDETTLTAADLVALETAPKLMNLFLRQVTLEGTLGPRLAAITRTS